jgi:hypothetical protein
MEAAGVLNETTINKIIAFGGEQEATFGKPFNRFTDMSAVDSVDLNTKNRSYQTKAPT